MKAKKGNEILKSTLVQCGKAARNTQTYLGALYRKTAARRGGNIAAMAVGRSILEICYYMILRREAFVDLGADFFNRNSEDEMKRHVKKLKELGYDVSLVTSPAG